MFFNIINSDSAKQFYEWMNNCLLMLKKEKKKKLKIKLSISLSKT